MRLRQTAALALPFLLATTLLARPWYLDGFVTEYPESTLPARYSCGICHYESSGGGDRNRYGQDFEEHRDFVSLEILDSDDDEASNRVEIKDLDTAPGFAGEPAPSAGQAEQSYLMASGAPDVNYDRAFDVADVVAANALHFQARLWHTMHPAGSSFQAPANVHSIRFARNSRVFDGRRDERPKH